MPNEAYTADPLLLSICMVAMFVELYFFHKQYREQIAKGKEVPAAAMKGLAIVAGLVILLEVIFSLFQLPVHPLYLLMDVVPLFFFRYGMYEEGVYRFGKLYRWKDISSCQILAVGKVMKIQFTPKKGNSFTLEFDGEYQNFLLSVLTVNHFMGGQQEQQ